MTKKILLSLFFVFNLTFSQADEKQNKIVINGNERISDETIIVYGGIDQNKLNNETAIIKFSMKLIFEDVKVVLDKILRIDVKEYPLINQLIFWKK